MSASGAILGSLGLIFYFFAHLWPDRSDLIQMLGKYYLAGWCLISSPRRLKPNSSHHK